MKVAVTGVQGFLGWHTRCALKARGDHLVPLDEADVVLHLAGVNRAEPALLRARNLSLAHELTRALDRTSGRPHVVFANSIHSGNGTPFGTARRPLLSTSSRGATGLDQRCPTCDCRTFSASMAGRITTPSSRPSATSSHIRAGPSSRTTAKSRFFMFRTPSMTSWASARAGLLASCVHAADRPGFRRC